MTPGHSLSFSHFVPFLFSSTFSLTLRGTQIDPELTDRVEVGKAHLSKALSFSSSSSSEGWRRLGKSTDVAARPALSWQLFSEGFRGPHCVGKAGRPYGFEGRGEL